MNRRNFIVMAVTMVGATIAGLGVAMRSRTPKTPTTAPLKVDISKIPLGSGKTINWNGRPVFVRHRTPEEIASARAVDVSTLKHPETDEARVQKPEWLIVFANCTHLGCIPIGIKAGTMRGDYGGFVCPCHISQYDTSGRIRVGVAPKNLIVPPYRFIDDKTLELG